MVSNLPVNFIGNLNMIKPQTSLANPSPQGNSVFGKGGGNSPPVNIVAFIIPNKGATNQAGAGNNFGQFIQQIIQGLTGQSGRPQARRPMPSMQCSTPQAAQPNCIINNNFIGNQMSIGAGSTGGMRPQMGMSPSVAMGSPMSIGAGSVGGMQSQIGMNPTVTMGHPMSIGAGSIGGLSYPPMGQPSMAGNPMYPPIGMQPARTRPVPGMPIYPEVGGTPLLPAAPGTIGIGSAGQYPPPTMI